MAGGSPFISDAMWSLWQQCLTFIPGVRLGGIYASKSGYHNTVDANQLSWPGNYSILLSYDLKKPHDRARAIDLTMSDAEMRLRTGYLQRSALDPRDNRLRHLREFYGTLNSVTVYGLIKDSPDGPWRAASSDSTHLWHIHASVMTEFVNDVSAMNAHASVLSGQSFEDWANQPPEGDMADSTLVKGGMWRVGALITGSDNVEGVNDGGEYSSPTAGEAAWIVREIKAIRTKVDSLASGGASADAIAAALIANPAFKAMIKQAAFEAAQQAEGQ